MQFRYDFGQKLDLSNFKKQFLFFLNQRKEVTYSVYLFQFKLFIITSYSNSGYILKIKTYELVRDSDDAIIVSNIIYPHNSPKLKGVNVIERLFGPDSPLYTSGCMKIRDPEYLVHEVCEVIKVLHKWKDLKAFL